MQYFIPQSVLFHKLSTCYELLIILFFLCAVDLTSQSKATTYQLTMRLFQWRIAMLLTYSALVFFAVHVAVVNLFACRLR